MECKGLFGLWFGHKYLPVFDVVQGTRAVEMVLQNFGKIKAERGNPLEGLITTNRLYNGHVCQRCGHVVKKQ